MSSGSLTTSSFDNSEGGLLNHTGGSLIIDGGSFDPGVDAYSIAGSNYPELKFANGASNEATLFSQLNVAHDWQAEGFGGLGGILTIESGSAVKVDFATNVWTLGSVNIAGGTFTGGTSFENMGTVSISSGTMDLSGMVYSQNGGITYLTGGVLKSDDFDIAGSTFNLNGGRYEFGTTTTSNLATLNLVSGELAGNINVSGVTHVGSLGFLQNTNPNVDISEVAAFNTGILYGSAFLDGALNNQASGELRTLGSDWVRFGGTGSKNFGEINNFGGVVDFGNDMTNEVGGLINGRGQFIADGGWTNHGEIRLSGGNSDILGDLTNTAVIISSGGATTTFYDNVVHSGTEIRTAAGSNTVFFGDVTGGGDYTGDGDVFYEGTYTPGESPDIINFQGNLHLQSNSLIEFEIAGLNLGEFDRFEIGGDLFLEGGGLSIELLDNFMLGFNMEFEIADVGNDLFGQFGGLDEGDLVGTYGGRELFISYMAGDGNNIALYTASIPEPGSAMVLLCLVVSVGIRRRRR